MKTENYNTAQIKSLSHLELKIEEWHMKEIMFLTSQTISKINISQQMSYHRQYKFAIFAKHFE